MIISLHRKKQRCQVHAHDLPGCHFSSLSEWETEWDLGNPVPIPKGQAHAEGLKHLQIIKCRLLDIAFIKIQ